VIPRHQGNLTFRQASHAISPSSNSAADGTSPSPPPTIAAALALVKELLRLPAAFPGGDADGRL
jgi:hypothetical protein